MSAEGLRKPPSPEGLTEIQQQLADLLFETKIFAPVGRRRQRPDGSYELYKVQRWTRPIDFAQEGEFAFKHHEENPAVPLSPVCANLRNLSPNVLELVGQVMAETDIAKPDFCFGIPEAGLPLVEAYSRFSGIPIAEGILVKEQKEMGRRIIPGTIKVERTRGLIIDDVITGGLSKLEAIEAAETVGVEVVGVLVLVDREQGGAKELEKLGYRLYSPLKLRQLIDYYRRTGRIDQARHEEVMNYLRQEKLSAKNNIVSF